MFVGHLAVALGAKKVEPRVPLSAGVAAAFGLDLLWPVLLLLGVERVRIEPRGTGFTGLAFESYPWSHSLLLALAWGALTAGVARTVLGALRPALVLGVLVASHWVLDLVTHAPDLALWPGGPLVGLGLWRSVPGTLVVEGLLFAAGIAAYLSVSRPVDGIGRWSLRALLGFCGLVWISQPWAPPPPSVTALAWTGIALWILVPWAHWAERHRELRDRA